MKNNLDKRLKEKARRLGKIVLGFWSIEKNKRQGGGFGYGCTCTDGSHISWGWGDSLIESARAAFANFGKRRAA